jgi:hypothetical protein
MNNQTKTYISCLENLIEESKAYLKALEQAKSNTNPVGIIISTQDGDGNDNQTILYEVNTYILIVPRGDRQHAQIYGNWEEALYASKRFLLAEASLQKELRLSIGRYLY